MVTAKAANKNASRWLKRHGQAERAIAVDLGDFASRQVDRVAAQLQDTRHPTPADIPHLLDADREHRALMAIVVPHLAKLLVAGADEILRTTRRGKHKSLAYAFKADDDDEETDLEISGGYQPGVTPTADDYIPLAMPVVLRQAIREALDELERQPYWREIQSSTQASIADLIRRGIDEGQSGSEMAKALREVLGGEAAKVRARAIARTETTLAFNAGHQASFNYLDGEGLLSGKAWLSIIDNRVRESHAALNDVTVRASEDFDVGGSPAPYPGHWSLPPEERVNCRCTVIGAVE